MTGYDEYRAQTPDAGRTCAKNAGFTLIEVMVALTIFTIGILGISGMLIIGERGIIAGSKSNSAVQVAKAQMEQLKGNSNIASGSGTCTTLLNTPEIQCEWAIREDTPEAGMSEIEVMASWNEGEKKRGMVLKTLKYVR